MWNMDFTQTSTRVAFLMAQFLIAMVCIIYLDYCYLTNILPDRKAQKNYQQTQCFLISKKLSSKNHFFHKYRSDFLISYNVNGVQYHRWVSGNGLDMSFSRNVGEQGDILAQYDTGKTYTCWYDPRNAQSALLVSRHNWVSVMSLMFPVVLGIMALYLMLRNLLRLLTAATIKTRQLVHAKRRKRHKKRTRKE